MMIIKASDYKEGSMTEHEEQVALFEWASLLKNAYPALDLMFAIPNGGARHVVVAKKLKAEGVKSGVPDICLPVAKGKYHGMFIEMKVGKNKPTDNQKEWIKALRAEGYKCVVCYGCDEAIEQIMEYLKLG